MQIKQQIGPQDIDISLLEELYKRFRENPSSLDVSWRQYFQNWGEEPQANKSLTGDSCLKVIRENGHYYATVNPLSIQNKIPLRSIPDHLDMPEMKRIRSIYCGPVGFECQSLDDVNLENWLEDYIETKFFQRSLSQEEQKTIFHYLNRSELFETFLHTKYPGQKRFSIEGAETLIPMLALFLETCEKQAVKEVVFGMAHRGRLNVLINILDKSTKAIFAEFDDCSDEFEGMGDVKYHKGFYKDSERIKVTLCPNPSHLESINCVAEGLVRAKQLNNGDQERNHIIPVLIHGDASVAGQGVVYETLQLSRLAGYTTGGTIHIVINNQIGFTTLPRDLQSTHYCTDIAKGFGLPIFHINAEDPENCVRVMLLAFEIRQKFHSDVFIDLYCYRKYGHNESDEPAFTQPLEYKLIKSKKPIREIYRDFLFQENIVDYASIEKLEKEFQECLSADLISVKESKTKSGKKELPSAKSFPTHFDIQTQVDLTTLCHLSDQVSKIPPNFTLHPKILNLVKERQSMMGGKKPIDWGMAETLAYASLLSEGVNVRLSGQDCERGTFSHRHALWVDQNKEEDYFPLAHLGEHCGLFEAINSPLSEMGVLGFEYGYSVGVPLGLTIWEAQFGDFCNGAQIIIDQYIASGEQKWAQGSNLVLFLPHGYEGQGPEHSSARMERFLILAGHENMCIIYPTTPSQMFHLLRRHVKSDKRRPLIVFTPKGLLRHPLSVSSLADLTSSPFLEIIDDGSHPKDANKIVFCTGRFYYDLVAQRSKLKLDSDIALVRIEQLYPLNLDAIKKIVGSYSSANQYLWVQEEPLNMGAWTYIYPLLQSSIQQGQHLKFVGRERSASPATGSHSRHESEHANLLKQVFEL